MTAGLLINGANGATQIDENYRNYFLVKSMRINAGAGGLAALDGTKFSKQALWAVIPLAAPGICPTPGGYYQSTRWFRYWFHLKTSVPTQVYIFDLVNPSGTTYGLEVFDAQSRLVYDGQGYPMKVHKLFSSAGLQPFGRPQYYDAPAGMTLAAAPLYGGNRYQDDSIGGDVEIWSTYGYVTGARWNFYDYYETFASGAPTTSDQGVAELLGLFIDVTHLPTEYSRAAA
ncbi:hypothetical protein P5705_00640 [Pseudomonas entomophila]|uniref:hypothetical protein n=1 Tax=Pseudomonas entomophila TaxID=312306 RepID=UPI00240580BF|nr:hypothetical protein [Pseudomonas entomophila]MDF9616140.1 hypothetical protein [Pseudomonas entomophila]